MISLPGAGSSSELFLFGKQVTLVPSPNVAEDHQTKNALALLRKGAALMVADKEAEDKLVPTALALVADEARLKQLSENIEAMAQRHSAERIVAEMVKIIERQK